MINNVVLAGRLTKDAELRYTGSGRAVATFTLAVNRQFTNAQGQREADFINVVAWGKTAETISQYTRKGSLIGVTGRIQTRNYENQQGQRVYVTEVVADNFTFLESRGSNEQRGFDNGNNFGGMQQQNAPQANYTNQTPPVQTAASNQQPNFARDDMFGGDSPIDIPDDDLPF
ncbi:single-strand DNA-binding protein [Pilibacter termitis]|uniref:Single-stranded DNA-binding protein n=1 Tax=Pilibacter termitis TaxID=263852 RepID=A0A1T4PWL5_9ENTE|nr:single-stranded DNA-binding protein [Pilibacter termitis]SJZ95875.1 single-strand DNA-binding protein [Pilibacter termitis]